MADVITAETAAADMVVGNDAATGVLDSVKAATATADIPDWGSDDGATADMDGTVGTGKKRRRKRNHATQDSQKHRRRMAGFTATHGGTPGPGPIPTRGIQRSAGG